jgi:hypothetical protein
MIATFRSLYRRLVPSWLQDPEEGARILFSLGTVADAVRDHAYLGLLARFPQRAPSDALSYHTRDRRIPRGLGESEESYAARLLPWLDAHRTRGNAFALLRQVRAYCNADVRVRTVDARGNWYTIDRDGTESFVRDQGHWDWGGAGASRWARFWVIIYPTSAGLPWNEGPVWGAPGLVWGSEGPDGPTWGTSATVSEVEGCRRIVKEWRPDGTRCEHIIIAFDDASFEPDGSSLDLPDGTWASTANRLSTARYWRGTRS